MIDPKTVCLFVGPGLKKFKLDLFMRIGHKIEAAGGSMIHGDFEKVKKLPDEIIPIIGCSPELTSSVKQWKERGRNFIYWDRGYARRVFATWLPRGDAMGIPGGYYRWHLNCYQMQKIIDVPSDRWDSLKTNVTPWKKNPNGHILIACPTPTYEKFHDIAGWTEKTLRRLARITDRQVVTRDKESKRDLRDDVAGAYVVVSHGSNAAVEAVIMGCPVVVDHSSAAALVGLTDLEQIENPVYPDRQPWLNSLAYNQFNEQELVDGTLWKLIT
jgi:hypothetical protein